MPKKESSVKDQVEACYQEDERAIGMQALHLVLLEFNRRKPRFNKFGKMLGA